MIDILLIGILAAVTYFVAQEGPWGAAFTLFAVIISGLIAMNFYEPLAEKLTGIMGFAWSERLDIVALLGIFSLFVFLIRMGTDYVMPTYVEVQGLLWDAGRWLLGAATGYVMVAIILTSLHTAPLDREFAGFTPERGNFLNMSPDRQWLAFVQYLSEKSFSSGPYRTFDYSEQAIPAPAPGNPTATPAVWQFSSFPIRYADRRERYAHYGNVSGRPAAAGPGTPAPAPAGGAAPVAPTGPTPPPVSPSGSSPAPSGF
jgi:uncharacterized membrane protein required for colicin V production